MQPRKHATKATRARRARSPESRRVAAWELDTWLGEGRWTHVYRARAGASSGNADYAIKLLKPEFAQDPMAIGLLQREGRVARELVHPHLISILDDHSDRPPFFLVSPYLEGATLRQTLDSHRVLPIPHALWIVRQVAEGLNSLHSAGWLHRDLKPENIFVSSNGHVTVCDLGLAQPKDGKQRDETLVGTPAYLPPEALCWGIDVTSASDVFSLGVTLYETLAGELPFVEEEPDRLAEAILTQPPPDPRRSAPHLPASVVRLLRRMLAKTPLRRPTLSELVPWLVDLEIETFDFRPAH